MASPSPKSSKKVSSSPAAGTPGTPATPVGQALADEQRKRKETVFTRVINDKFPTFSKDEEVIDAMWNQINHELSSIRPKYVDFARPAIPLGLVDEMVRGAPLSTKYTRAMESYAAGAGAGAGSDMVEEGREEGDDHNSSSSHNVTSKARGNKRKRKSVRMPDPPRRQATAATVVQAVEAQVVSDGPLSVAPESEIVSEKGIMTEPESEIVPTEANMLLAKALELFLLEMGTDAWRVSRSVGGSFDNNMITSDHIAAVVEKRDHLDFLCPVTSIWSRKRKQQEEQASGLESAESKITLKTKAKIKNSDDHRE